MRLNNLALTGVLISALFGTTIQTGCGGGSGDQTRAPETPVRVAAVDVTYYYLPG